MIIVMKKDCPATNIDEVVNVISSLGLKPFVLNGVERTVIAVIGDERAISDVPIELLPGVDRLIPILESYKLASKTFKDYPSVVKIGNVEIGSDKISLIAGPCAIESLEQMVEVAEKISKSGAKILRGGAYKPRTSPYSFQGLEKEGLVILRKAADAFNLLVISEVVSEEAANIAYDYVDIYQIGARNMQNFNLLKHVGRLGKPVLLKRGLSATIDEWLNAAEYILAEGNPNVILCERGIRTFETATRNTLDISAVPVIKEKSHLPIIIDPSHAAGKSKYVLSLARAAIAAGADGLMIEVHPNPKEALSDGPQSITPEEFDNLVKQISIIANAVGKSV
ncbi:3-deoxy-7-phosphoheptulonate synthase [Caldicellulosiruptoraceae bacterium PP1]